MRTDEILLLDMLLAAREAIDFLIDVSLEDFERDRMRQLAVIKSIETIGEAAAGISDAFRRAHPEIPWREIVGMRNRLVHGYFEISLDRLCRTVRQDLPPLVAALEKLAPTDMP
jgi:uncharacterized protein with HEPN domain